MLYMSNISLSDSKSGSLIQSGPKSGSLTQSGPKSGSLTPSCPHCINLNRFRPFYSHVPTDHFLRETRDRNSPVVCPMLKNVECSSCGLKGHTQSHCTNYTSLKIYNGVPEWRLCKPPSILIRKDVQTQINKSVSSIKEHCKSRFDILFEDDSSEEDDESGPFRPRSPDYPPP